MLHQKKHDSFAGCSHQAYWDPWTIALGCDSLHIAHPQYSHQNGQNCLENASCMPRGFYFHHGPARRLVITDHWTWNSVPSPMIETLKWPPRIPWIQRCQPLQGSHHLRAVDGFGGGAKPVKMWGRCADKAGTTLCFWIQASVTNYISLSLNPTWYHLLLPPEVLATQGLKSDIGHNTAWDSQNQHEDHMKIIRIILSSPSAFGQGSKSPNSSATCCGQKASMKLSLGPKSNLSHIVLIRLTKAIRRHKHERLTPRSKPDTNYMRRSQGIGWKRRDRKQMQPTLRSWHCMRRPCAPST